MKAWRSGACTLTNCCYSCPHSPEARSPGKPVPAPIIGYSYAVLTHKNLTIPNFVFFSLPGERLKAGDSVTLSLNTDELKPDFLKTDLTHASVGYIHRYDINEEKVAIHCFWANVVPYNMFMKQRLCPTVILLYHYVCFFLFVLVHRKVLLWA